MQFPILSHWLDEGFSTAQLRQYQDYYKDGLATQDFSPGSLTTEFIGRDDDIKRLRDFLESDKPMAVIAGEAGIGKTRLAIEFFEKLSHEAPNWTALVLVTRNFNFERLHKALIPGRNYLVLIDDAHTYEPRVIADMKAITAQLKNVKLILTTRNIQASSTLSLLKEYERDQVLAINLNELTREETHRIFLRYIENNDYYHYIDQLITISFGKPILIVAMLNGIRIKSCGEEEKKIDF